jgi:hypothetical protein
MIPPHSSRQAVAAALFSIACALPDGAVAATLGAKGLSLGDNGTMLVTMADLTKPSQVTGIPLFGPGGVNALDALAYRPRTDELYGYNSVTRTVYLVNTGSGELVPIATSAVPINVAEIGFDFNNLIDAARLVSTADDNQVFFPNNMPPNIASFTTLFYGAGDVNEGVNPSIFANAYTNQVPFPTSTLQYVLDSETDSLATLANNAGTLTTVGKITLDGMLLDFTAAGGFDIFSLMDGDNSAFALLTTANGLGLYALDLMAGIDGTVAATYLGLVGDTFGPLDSLAVVPAPIPLPASVVLLAGALGGLHLIRRRRSAAA